MEHLHAITTRNVTSFISLSSLSPHAKILSVLNNTVPLQSKYVQGRKNQGDLDLSCLILGSKWTLGFPRMLQPGRKPSTATERNSWSPPHHSFPSSPCPVADEGACFDPVLPSGSPCAGTASSVGTKEGAAQAWGWVTGIRVHRAGHIANLKLKNCFWAFFIVNREQTSRFWLAEFLAGISVLCLVSSALFYN